MINIHLFYCSFLNIAISLWFPKFNCYFLSFIFQIVLLILCLLCFYVRQTLIHAKKKNNPYLIHPSYTTWPDEAAVNQQHYYNWILLLLPLTTLQTHLPGGPAESIFRMSCWVSMLKRQMCPVENDVIIWFGSQVTTSTEVGTPSSDSPERRRRRRGQNHDGVKQWTY